MQVWSTGKWMLRVENTNSPSVLPNLRRAHNHSVLWEVFRMNKSPAASLLQKWGEYFFIFLAAVNFSKTLHPSGTKWWKCVIKQRPLEYSGRNVVFKKTKEKHFPILYWTLQNFRGNKRKPKKGKEIKWTRLRGVRTILSFMFLLLRNIGPVNDLTHVPRKFKTSKNWVGEEMFCTSATEKKKIYK